MRSCSRGNVLSLLSVPPPVSCHTLVLPRETPGACCCPQHTPARLMMMFLPYAFDNVRLHALRTPQGKVAELRLELNSGGKKDKNFSAKKTALKKIVANMTMSNNDMVALFPDIVGCMHIPSLEIKKMCAMLSVTTKHNTMLTTPGASCIWSTMLG